ncbi:MAG: hypothetical protein O2967_10790 [Proteobacteria bacterium]|nr:hypothetical protein [Pseudomonadota bacterium]
MARRRIEELPPLAIASDVPIYSDDDVSKIVEAVGKKFLNKHRSELSDRLNGAAETYATDRYLQRLPTDKMTMERFEEIDRAAGAFLKTLGAGPAGGIRAMPTPILDGLMKAAISASASDNGVRANSDTVLAGLIVAANKKATRLGKSSSALVRNALDGVVMLQRLARQQAQAASLAQEQSGNTRSPNIGDQALDRWILSLGDIYRDLWKGKPGVSYSQKVRTYSGPFYRFVETSGQAIRIKKTNLALGKRISRLF